MRRLLSLAALTASFAITGHSQGDKDLTVLHQIKTEAFDNSKVMDELANISDLYGSRLTASPEWDQAAEWAMKAMKGMGLSNVHEEAWGPFGRAWSIESYTVDMLTPRYSHLVAVPLAWSSPTNGVQSGALMYAPLPPARWYSVKKFNEALEEYKKEWHGKLKGKNHFAYGREKAGARHGSAFPTVYGRGACRNRAGAGTGHCSSSHGGSA